MNRKTAVLAVVFSAATGLWGAAQAAGKDCPGDGKPMAKPGAMHSEMMDPSARVERRLARLKAELKPTGQQEPLWQAFAEKSKSEAAKNFQAMSERMKSDKPMTAPERLAQVQDQMKLRLAGMESVSESFKNLYAVLSAEQKSVADQHFSGMGRRARRADTGAAAPKPQGHDPAVHKH